MTVALFCLALLAAWWSIDPAVEVHGRFSDRDIAELRRLGRAENRRDIKSEWSRSGPGIRQVFEVLRRFTSEKVVRIERTPDDKAVVTTGTGRSESSGSAARYLFVNVKQGWKRATPEFE